MQYGAVLDDKQLAPSALPPARGLLTDALFDLLSRDATRPRLVLPRVVDSDDDPLYGDDSALALYALYELHYRGFDGVDVEWEWQPDLLAWRREFERAVLTRLHDEVGSLPERPQIPDALHALMEDAGGPASPGSFFAPAPLTSSVRWFSIGLSTSSKRPTRIPG